MTRKPTALLKYSTRNLGDDIQTFAVKQYVSPDQLLDRDQLAEDAIDCNLVLFGWLLQSGNWPPKVSDVHPLSIHASYRSRPMLTQHITWWRKFGCVSCRDTSTTEYFLNQGIDARVDGCVTLSLKRWLPKETGTVALVDIDSASGNQPKVNFPHILRCTHHLMKSQRVDQDYRNFKAKELLETYQRCELVITSRLHAALPCLAFGTPVVFVLNSERGVDSHWSRFLDYLPYFSVWNGTNSFHSGNEPPKNYQPAERIDRITQRLESIRNCLSTRNNK